ncbi:MAG: transglycosylase domain-containing protein [Prevotellaceae bacterium]|nr:transglycosylase domain-containing protein [Prevotellaceae bacterium]
MVVVVLFLLISKGAIGYLPPIDELQNPKNKYATEIYSSDLKIIGHYFQNKENRVGVDFNAISPNLINALIATEDVRFYDHSGVDGKALLRALVYLGKAGGGSTITQQLAKLLYSPASESLIGRAMKKPIEWVIAVKLERLYTKEEIIAMYLNQFDFLNNAVGIKSAVQVYFNTTPDNLSIEQAATLVGMCKNPSLYNPVRFNARTRDRRNVVLKQMVKGDYITVEQYDSLKQLPLELNYQQVDHKLGLAPYFREYLRMMLSKKEPNEKDYTDKERFRADKVRWENDPLYGFCSKNRKADGSPYNIYTDGLKIYTTIDSRMQQYAEEAVMEHMSELQKSFFKEKAGRGYAPFERKAKDDEINRNMNRSMRNSERYRKLKQAGVTATQIEASFNEPVEMLVFSYKGLIDTIMSPLDSIRYNKHFLRCGFMSIDPLSGHVKAYVGGPNFEQFQYDMVSQGRRQIGSTVKPFLYTLAMEEGLQPCDSVKNQAITLYTESGTTWSPRNSRRERIGEVVSLKWALQTSNNWISAYLMSLFTPQSLVNLMHSFGITGQLDPVLSLALGPCEVSVEELVDAYTAYPNKGVRVEPLYVTRIEDNNGNVIKTFTPQMHEIFSEEASYKMLDMLKAVVDGGGSGRIRFRYGITAQMGAKTGTTNDNADGWFVGFTPSLVSGVWVGGEDRSIHFDTMAEGQGANMALPIWAIYMKKVFEDKKLGYFQSELFDIPPGRDVNTTCRRLDPER